MAEWSSRAKVTMQRHCLGVAGEAIIRGTPDPTPHPSRRRLVATVSEQASRLVGREPELRALARALTLVEGGRSALVELAGEPGIGKTRLLAELRGQADAAKPPRPRRQRGGVRA